MLRKLLRLAVACILLLGIATPIQSFASNAAISIIIDGKKIVTDQPPVIQGGRTLVPLRAIFEGLQAAVDFNSNTKTITAVRGNTTIVLTLGSKNATINNKSVQLDVPAQALKGRTLVPVRFVSEALGDDVNYNAVLRTVEIATKNDTVSDLIVKDINDWGDGRDLYISFTKARNESQIDHYRALVVKTSKLSSFNVNRAMNLSTNRYLTISKGGPTIQKTFLSNSQDIDGESIQNDIAYTLFIVSVNKNNNIVAFESTNFTLTSKLTVDAVKSVQVKDVSDYGDGRDLELSFNKITDESNLLQYRAIVVRADEANAFNLSMAKEVSTSNYISITKTNSNIKQILSSWTRDNQGRLLQSGVAYKVFILSVGNQTRSYGSSLSSPSGTITLTSNPEEIRVAKLSVKDTFDYGNGQDLEVTFTAPNNATRVSEYRIFVVREADVKNFNLTKAENTSSNYYTVVSKNSSSDMTVNLSSGARDVSGYYIQSETPYRVFILSVGNQANSYKNSLSTASASIKLTDNQLGLPVTNLVVRDIGDWGDGRDFEVSFNKVLDETKINEYRIMVVKSAQSGGFNLNVANSTSYYTPVPKTGANLKRTLLSTSKDIYGEVIREGVAYKVFILTVSSGGNNRNNGLSAASPVLTLTNNAATRAATNVTVDDIGNAGDGRDLEIKFKKATDESTMSEYRIMVVKSNEAASFDLTKANRVSSANYTVITKTGKDVKVNLDANSKDINGASITFDQDYTVFVLSISSTGTSNALSAPSNNIVLSNPQVQAATNVIAEDISNIGNGEDLKVYFTKANPETNIAYYVVLVVKEAQARTFNLSTANSIYKAHQTKVEIGGDPLILTFGSDAIDTDGQPIRNGVSYKVFVLSVANGSDAAINALSAPSTAITLN